MTYEENHERQKQDPLHGRVAPQAVLSFINGFNVLFGRVSAADSHPGQATGQRDRSEDDHDPPPMSSESSQGVGNYECRDCTQ